MLVFSTYIYSYLRTTYILQKRDTDLQNLSNEFAESQPITPNNPSNRIPELPSSISYFAKRDIKAKNLITGTDWRYVEYSYNIYAKTKYGEYVAKTIFYSVLELDLPRRLPNMLFDSQKARGKQFKMVIDASQVQHLEGNFDKYFSAYFPTHYNIDSLSLISPEVMEALINSSDYDIEISGDKVYLFGSLHSPEATKRMIDLGLNIRNKLLNNAITYKDERLPSNIGRNGVSSYGIQLRENVWAGAGIIGVGILLAAIGILPLFNTNGSKEPSGHFYYGIILISYGIFKVSLQKYKSYKLDKAYHQEFRN